MIVMRNLIDGLRRGQKRAGQDKRGESRRGQKRAGQDKRGESRRGQKRAGQDRTKEERAEEGGQDRIG